MLDCKLQPPLAAAVASILRAQLGASSDALAASLRGWSMLWTQMLKTWPQTGPEMAINEQPMPARLWPIPGPVLWPIPSLIPWPITWPMHRSLAWPMPSPWLWLEAWQEGIGDSARLGFVPLAPIWWFCAPPPGAPAGKHNRLRQSMAEPPSAVHAAGLDAGFASYRSAGGHALAQVIVPPTEELAEATARAWRSPLEAMLGVWRATLGL